MLKIEGLTQSGWVVIVSNVKPVGDVTNEEAIEEILDNLGKFERLWLENVSFYPKSFLAIRVSCV